MIARAPEDYNSYIFGAASDVERLVLQQNLFVPSFTDTMTCLLHEYGLIERFAGGGGRILDFGCAHGRYVEVLQKLLANFRFAGTRIDGLDLNAEAINYARNRVTSGNSRVVFAHFDGTRPLAECAELNDEGTIGYDYIYALLVLEHFAEPQVQLSRLYHYLKPGGVIYLRDFVMDEGMSGWSSPHPAAREVSARLFGAIPSVRAGFSVAEEQAGWLKNLGAQRVATIRERVTVGGPQPHGAAMLRLWLQTIGNGGRYLVTHGFLDQRDLDAVLSTLSVELTEHHAGHVTYCTTLARRPADAEEGRWTS
jgi:SAM-dependent methyltransferase